MRATLRFSLVASWRATVRRSGLLLVRATARMAASDSWKLEDLDEKLISLLMYLESSGQELWFTFSQGDL